MTLEVPRRSPCPIATTLDLVGDKWTLIVVRDMIAGRRKFSEFLASPEGIRRNILTERLRRLEAAGIVRKRRYQTRPERFEYHLTRRGAELLPVLQGMARWASANYQGTWAPGDGFLSATPNDFVSGEDDD